MTVFLQRLTWQEMLQELHVRMAQVRAYIKFSRAQPGTPLTDKSRAVRFAVRFEIQVSAPQVRILVGIFAEDETGRLLVKIRDRDPQRRIAA